MSKQVENLKSIISEGYRDLLLDTFSWLDDDNARDEMIIRAREENISLGNIEEFIEKLRTSMPKFESNETSASSTRDKYSSYADQLIDYIADATIAQRANDPSVQRIQDITETYGKGLYNLFAWLPDEESRVALLFDIQTAPQSLPMKSIDDIMVEHLLLGEQKSKKPFAIREDIVAESPEDKRLLGLVESSITTYAAQLGSDQAPSNAQQVEVSFNNPKQAWAAYYSEEKKFKAAQTRFAAAKKSYEKSIKSFEKDDHTYNQETLTELTQAADDLQFIGKNLAGIINSEHIQNYIKTYDNKSFAAKSVIGTFSVDPKQLRLMQEATVKAEESSKLAHSAKEAQRQARFEGLSQRLPTTIRESIKRSGGEIKLQEQAAVRHLLDGARTYNPATATADFIIQEFEASGFSPDLQREIIEKTLAKNPESLSAFTQIFKAECDTKRNMVYEMHEKRPNAEDFGVSAAPGLEGIREGALIHGVSTEVRQGVQQMCANLNRMFQSQVIPSSKSGALQAAEKAPKISLSDPGRLLEFIFKTAAKNTIANPALQAGAVGLVSSAAGGLASAIAYPAAKAAIMSTSEWLADTATAMKAGHKPKVAAAIATARIGVKSLFETLGIEDTLGVKDDLMELVEGLADEFKRPEPKNVRMIEDADKKKAIGNTSNHALFDASSPSAASQDSSKPKSDIAKTRLVEKAVKSGVERIAAKYGLSESVQNIITSSLTPVASSIFDSVVGQAQTSAKDAATKAHAAEDAERIASAQELAEVMATQTPTWNSIGTNILRAFDAVAQDQARPDRKALLESMKTAALAGTAQTIVDTGLAKPETVLGVASAFGIGPNLAQQAREAARPARGLIADGKAAAAVVHNNSRSRSQSPSKS